MARAARASRRTPPAWLTPPLRDGTFPGMEATRVCRSCPERPQCTAICEDIEAVLPSMEAGRIDPEDLPRLWRGMMFTRAILDHENILTIRQREVVRLYYREQKEQKEIAACVGISQQAVNDALERARKRIGDFLKAARKASS